MGLVLIWLLACGGAPTARMAACPASPNCVSSTATDSVHAVAPFEARDPAEALRVLGAAVRRVDGFTAVLVEDDGYLHATFTTPTLRFVDDLELQVGDGVVHVRSASRLGHGDGGVNRARVEALRREWGPPTGR